MSRCNVLISCVLTLLFSAPSFAGWTVQSVDTDGKAGMYTSLALDTNNYPAISYYAGAFVGEYCSVSADTNNIPHICYYDWAQGDLKYATKYGGIWEITAIDTIGDVGEHSSIALDSQNRPHIAYYDWTNDDLKYAKWNGSAWEIQTVDSTGDIGEHTAITVDSLGNPHISYYSWTGSYLKYAKWNGASWEISVVDNADTVGEYTSIKVDTNNIPHISYYDSGGADLKYAKWTGVKWSTSAVDTLGAVGQFTSMALDSSNNPGIAYFDWSAGGLKYAKWTGSVWNISTVDSGTDFVGEHGSLVYINNLPNISYYDWTNHDLKYAKWTGSVWEKQVIDSAGDVGTYSSLARGINNNLHLAYFDSSNFDLKYAKYNGSSWEIETVEGQPNCLKLARWTGTSWSIQTIDNLSDAGQYNSLVIDSGNNPKISYYDWTSSDLKYASYSTSTGWDIDVIDAAEDVGQYTSLALDSSGHPQVSYYDSSNARLKYAEWNGSSWSYSVVDSSGQVGMYNSVKINSQNIPCVSYYDWIYGNLRYSKWTGTTWYYEIVDSSGDVGLYTSLQLDNDGHPRVSYYDWTNGDLKYAEYTTSGWVVQTVDSIDDVGWHTSLDLDSNGYPHIAYYDWTNNDLKYAYWTGTSWSIQRIDAAGDVGEYCKLVLDSNNNAYISYLDWTTSVLKLAKYMPDSTVYYIKGYVRDSSGFGISNATVTLSGNQIYKSFTDNEGYYEFTAIPSGDWTITPVKSGWSFNPMTYVYRPLSTSFDDQTFVGSYTGSETRYYIKGYVRDSNSVPVDGFTIALTGKTTGYCITNTSGYYEFLSLSSGSYIITPTKYGWSVTPGSRSVASLTANLSDQNYTALQIQLSVQGYVLTSSSTGISQTTVTITGDKYQVYLTTSSGYYYFSNLAYGNYGVAAYKTGWNFNPINYAYQEMETNQTTQNFVGASVSTSSTVCYIKGYIRNVTGEGVSNFTVSLSGKTSGKYITGTDGYYEFLNLSTGTYTITPNRTGWVASPVNKTLNLTSSQGNQNFAVSSVFFIKGYVRKTTGYGINGTTVTLSGTKSASYVTNSSGYYEFINLSTSNYIVTPIRQGYMFNPFNKLFYPLTTQPDTINFVGTFVTGSLYYIKGYLRDGNNTGIANITVSISGIISGSCMTNISGYYEFLNLSTSTYTITPMKTGLVFSPSTKTINLLSNQDNQNFSVVTKTYSINGYVRASTGNAIEKATVTLSGDKYLVVITTGSGYYQFISLNSGNYVVSVKKEKWVFSPPTNSYNPLDVDKQNQNFVASGMKYYIKGYLRDFNHNGISGVQVLLTGISTGSYTTDSTGYYQFLSLSVGEYTVSPVKNGSSFSPYNKQIILDSNRDEQNFTGYSGVNMYKISGKVVDSAGMPLAGIKLSLSIDNSGIIVTDSAGKYYLSNLLPGDYKLIPEKEGYSFSPKYNKLYLSSNIELDDFISVLGTLEGKSLGLKPVNNLFNPSTGQKVAVWYNTTESNEVVIKVFTLDGILVKTLRNETQLAGQYAVSWDGEDDTGTMVPSGVYLVQIRAGSYKDVKKIVVIK
ncbi:MAG: carboxypeptidase regulatory-like domain-containing protein [Elusimicrobiota bacterium]